MLELVRSVWFGLVQLTLEGKSEHKVTNYLNLDYKQDKVTHVRHRHISGPLFITITMSFEPVITVVDQKSQSFGGKMMCSADVAIT